MEKSSKIFVAGHRGLVGSAILANLKSKGYTNLVTRTRKQLNLLDTDAVSAFFEYEQPEYVFLAAAKVGGIAANNTYRADFLYENLCIQNNVIHQSFESGVKKLLFLGSTCIYPKNCKQPIKEEYLLTDVLEYTNEPYAVAKIAGIKLCESYNIQYGTNFMSVMPTNLYGPNDNFDLEKSHVLPALLRKIHLGKILERNNELALRQDLNALPIGSVDGTSSMIEMLTALEGIGVYKTPERRVTVEIWGSGKPKREFLWSEDMADACVFIIEKLNFSDLVGNNVSEIRNTHINIGTGTDIAIKDLADLIKELLNFHGIFVYNTEKPDGTLQKLIDIERLNALGWKHKVGLTEGIARLYDWYLRKYS